MGERTGNAGRDDNDVGILESGLGTVVGRKVAGGFLLRKLVSRGIKKDRIRIELVLTALEEM